MQNAFDELYEQSKQEKPFCNLYDIITSKQNIILAYRSIKRNKGSETHGVNQSTIRNWEKATTDEYVGYVQRRFQNYHPHKVRRVEIPKKDGRMRPLGIPTMEDRFIQECIKQVLEPIAEARFYPASYGFRPNRSTAHAIADFLRMVNINHMYFVVDIDIKGFFDNVNHGKLLKQLWAIGIQDKKLLSIISKMLKAEIEGIGIPEKGTPQGGILSPLLANVVLNELDWWIDSQWRSFNAKEIKPQFNKNGSPMRGNEMVKLRASTDLKEMYIVRYADDFKILCASMDEAQRCFEAIRLWLKDRLSLEINPEKSKVLDIRKESSEFLGFRFKAKQKNHKWVVQSHMTDKSKENAIAKLRECIDRLQKKPTAESALYYNSVVAGLQGYYNTATNVSLDFSEINYRIMTRRYNRLKTIMSDKGNPGKTFIKWYGKYNCKRQFVAGICLFPVHAVKHKNPMNFTTKICNYTAEGRALIHKSLEINTYVMHYVMKNPPHNSTVEFADNRISKFSAQWGKCAVTGEELSIGHMECHHIKPKEFQGTDEYNNLVWVTSEIHELIHATNLDTITKYLAMIPTFNKEKRDKLNALRIKAESCVIE